MKKLVLVMAIMIAGVIGANAQMTQNQFNVGASFLRSSVDFNVTPQTTFNDSTDSFGLSAGYTRFTAGKGNKVGTVGLTTDFSVNFNSNEVTMVTAMAGIVAEARNNTTVQPYVRGLVGVAHQNYTYSSYPTPPTFDNSNTSAAFDLGAGIDWRLGKGSRTSLRTGVDYLNTGFAGERQNNVRATIGLVF